MASAEPIYYYQKRLREELAVRMDRNSRYSMRSFATTLGLGSGDLSQILSGKRSISAKVATRILNNLELNAQELKQFLESIVEEKRQKGIKKISPELKARIKQIKASKPSNAIHDLRLDEFRVIADWYHSAILELTTAKNFKPDSKWIARALNISAVEAKHAVERLLDLKLLEKRNGTLVKTNLKVQTKDQTKTSLFHRKRQRQILEKSTQSLENDALEVRNHSAMTLCIDPRLIPEARVKIQKFMWDLSQFLISGSSERVYEMQLSLFPLQIKEQTLKKDH